MGMFTLVYLWGFLLIPLSSYDSFFSNKQTSFQNDTCTHKSHSDKNHKCPHEKDSGEKKGCQEQCTAINCSVFIVFSAADKEPGSKELPGFYPENSFPFYNKPLNSLNGKEIWQPPKKIDFKTV